MSILDKLTITEGTKAKGYDPVQVRRRKMAKAIDEQLRLLKAEAEGGSYSRTVRRRSRDLETDQVVETTESRRVSPWWWPDNGAVNLSIRYGSMPLRLKGDKTTIILKAASDVTNVLTAFKAEVIAGAFDDMLTQAAEALRGRFGKRADLPAS